MTDATGFWSRFTRTLRRRWWLVPLGAVLMGALTVASGGLQRYSATNTVYIGELTARSVEDASPVPVGPTASLEFLLASIDNAAVEAEAAAGAPLTVDLTLRSNQRIFVIRTTAESARVAERGGEFLVEELRRQHLAQLEAAIDPQAAIVQTRIDAGRQALAAVDNQLATAVGVEATGLAIERATRTTELIVLEGQLAALDGLLESSPPTISVATEPAEPILGVTRLGLSGVLGMILAAAVIAALAWLDRRIWNTADLDRAGVDGVLGDVPTLHPDEGAVAAAAAAIHHGARGAESIQLVPASPGTDLEPLAKAIAAALSAYPDAPPINVAPALAEGSDALVATAGSATVLVVRPGTITTDALRTQLRQFHNVGVDHVGVVLVGPIDEHVRPTAGRRLSTRSGGVG